VDTALDEVEPNDRFLAVILVVNSPGGVISDGELAAFVDRIATAKVPVTAWVGPSGAQAEGEAAELVLALEGSTMAPATRIGKVGTPRLAAEPYGSWQTDDAVDIRSTAVSAGDAADQGLIPGVAVSLGDHAIDLEGVPTETVTDSEGRPKRQLNADQVTQTLPVTTQLFHTAASPAIAYLMLGLAIGLLLFEFFTAGVGIAGVVGAMAALLAGYGLAALPTRPWALAVCLLAAVAFAVDIQTAIPRFWTAAGFVAWSVGSVFLFDGIRAPIVALLTGILGMATTMFSGMPSMVRSRFSTPTIGRQSMIGQIGTALSAVSPEGVVEVDGGRWRAITNRATPLAASDPLRVIGIDGLTLEVEPVEGAARDYREMRSSKDDADSEGARDS
jgi:membrane-bound serine protease (ClpP class)